MNLREKIIKCLESRKWTVHRLAREAGLNSDMSIRRLLSGERQGMHSKNLEKILPFFCEMKGKQSNRLGGGDEHDD